MSRQFGGVRSAAKEKLPHALLKLSSSSTVKKEEKPCSRPGGGCEGKGKYTFTEDHVEAQKPEDGVAPLKEGVYCLECVTQVAPRCSNFETKGCQGRRLISPPNSQFSYKLFCAACLKAYRDEQDALFNGGTSR